MSARKHAPDLADVLTAGSSNEEVMVAVYAMTGAQTLRENQSEDEWLEQLAAFHRLVESAGSDDTRVDRRTLYDAIRVVYPIDSDLAPLIAARAALDRSRDVDRDGAWDLSVGLATGGAYAFSGPDGRREYAGWVVDRAIGLAHRATGGQVLVDTELADRAEHHPVVVAGDMEILFGGTTRIRVRGLGGPLSFREYLWRGHGLFRDEHIESHVRAGSVATWDAKHGRGLIITENDERFYTDRRHLVGNAKMSVGQRAFFVDEEPRGSAKANRLAAATVVLGSRIEGRVSMIDLEGRVGFVEVYDRAGFTQRLITAKDADIADLQINTLVQFLVDENVRGPVAADVRIVHQAVAGHAVRPTVASRFMSALTAHLRRSGKHGAAAAVLRVSSGDLVPANIDPWRQRCELLALASYAVRSWAVAGLKASGDSDLAAPLSGLIQISQVDDAAVAENQMGAIRRALKERGPSPGHRPVTRQGVQAVLAEIQLALRHVSRLNDDDPFQTEDQTAAVATEHFGYALAQAFAAGVITSLPPESREVFRLLAQLQPHLA